MEWCVSCLHGERTLAFSPDQMSLAPPTGLEYQRYLASDDVSSITLVKNLS